jgi:hypothetical protein
VPPEIRYTENRDQLEATAGQIERALAPGSQEHLSKNRANCGPFLWAELKPLPAFAQANLTTVHISVPLPGGAWHYEGRLIEKADDPTALVALETQLRQWTQDDGGFHVRKLTVPELQLLWAMITFDITDPALVVESNNHKLVMVLHEGDALIVDDYHNITPARRQALRTS